MDSMKKCKQCDIEKELSDFYYNKSLNYYDVKCKSCRSSNNKKNTKKKNSKIKYQKVKNLINPDNPIPLKLVGQDGFGGKWSYDLTRLKEPLMLAFAQQYGYVLSKRKGIYQLKSKSEQQLKDFAISIDMNPIGVYKIQRESDKQHLECYVVNLHGVRL